MKTTLILRGWGGGSNIICCQCDIKDEMLGILFDKFLISNE